MYITISKRIKEFDVLISDDPREFNGDENIDYKNLLRVYCRTDKHYATLLISKEMLKDLVNCDNFIHKMLTYKFAELTVS